MQVSGTAASSETNNVHYIDGMLQVILSPETELENDCRQAIGNWVYCDGQRDHVIVVPETTESGKLWDRIGFELSREPPIQFES